MIELTLVKELMLIKQTHQKSAIFATIGTAQIKGLSFESYVSNGCHDVLMASMNVRDIGILEIFGFDYAVLSTKLA